MAVATDELVLLERVFLRLGSAESDEQLQASVCKFLPPVLLKLSSAQEGVRKKVMELLIHINKRIKSRPQVQLPVEALLLQYQDPTASSFVINFTIIYIKIGYPRMEINKQVELIPSVLNAIEGKPLPHQDSLMLIIMPTLGHITVPMDVEKKTSFLGLHDKPLVTKHLISFMLDVLLLPYGSIGSLGNQQTGQSINWSQFPVPPGLSEYSFKRVIGENPPTAEQLEKTKLGIVKFLIGGLFPNSDIFIHLIVAAADTRFSVANAADSELKKMMRSLDWSSAQLAAPLYTLFLGIDSLVTQKEVGTEMKRVPASTRIRLKLLHYLCRVTKAGFIIPPCIQVIFDSLYGKNTNSKLKSLALQFTSNLVQQCSYAPLTRVAGVILNGMIKLISEGEAIHKPAAYAVIGQLGLRIPSLINKDLSLLENLFETLATTDGELKTSVRDALICVSSAYKLSPEDQANISIMNALLSSRIESPESSVRFVAMHYAATVLPANDAPSRYILLLACGDNKHEISLEAKKALYQTTSDHDKSDIKQMIVPDFLTLVVHVNTMMQAKLSAIKKTNAETLPYNVPTFLEMITYLRICLAKSANVTNYNEPLQHPCESTPLIGKYLDKFYIDNPESLQQYLNMIMIFSRNATDVKCLNALLEVVGSISKHMTTICQKELPWIYALLGSTKAEVRELAAKIYAIVVTHSTVNDFEKDVKALLKLLNQKDLESQHGALIALSYMMERKLIQKRDKDNEIRQWTIYYDVVKSICEFLNHNANIMMEASIQSIGLLGKTYALPLPLEDTDQWNKQKIVDILFTIFQNPKMNTKTKEKAALSLGYLCVGEKFPLTSKIVEQLIASAKETKDVEIHMAVGEALVLCTQGPASSEGRDGWTTLPSEYKIEMTNESVQFLMKVLDEIRKIGDSPHPNSRQAVCVWLLILLKNHVKHICAEKKLPALHESFMNLLGDDNDLIQDLASKGLGFVNTNSDPNDRQSLLSTVMDQFIHGRRKVQQVTPDTKLFEEGQLGQTPSGGNLSTYREICSFATEIQNPELVYYFMNIANHNANWASKKGAAFGFAAIANFSPDEANKYLPNIVPKLYRYQFDPIPKIQQSMKNIWRAVVPSTQKVIEQFHAEIMEEISNNLNNSEWRVRMSCCSALADLVKTRAPFDFARYAPDLWTKLFRVMDDYHEGTRLAATSTAQVFSKVCVRYCDFSRGKAGEEVVQAILPVFLDTGITHNVDTVRAVSLQTVSQLISAARDLLKPSLVNLIPALLTTIGESDSPKLSYLSNIFGGTTELQEVINNFRASEAKGHYASETISRCLTYIDSEILKDLMPKLIELMKTTTCFGTKIACSHFITLLTTHMNKELTPYTGKVMNVLINGLLDRNVAVRKSNAHAIGHLVKSAKESSVDKLFKTLNTWYMEKEDDGIRLVIGQTLHSVTTYNQDIWKNHSNIVIPLTFYAMHAQKVQGNENTIEVWSDLWNDITPGTENGIKQNLKAIVQVLRPALESSSWNTKIQAANAVGTIALKLKSDIDEDSRHILLTALLSALKGKTWDGKEQVINSFGILACNSKESLIKDKNLLELVIESLHRESKKESIEYRRHALKAYANVLHDLDIDQFANIYVIIQHILTSSSDKRKREGHDSSDDEDKQRKDKKLLLEGMVYEILGKAWPTCKQTQDKYCIEFATFCQSSCNNSTKSAQASILVSLNLFVDKLAILKMKNNETTTNDKEMLNTICNVISEIFQKCIATSKYTVIRKESLNLIISLSKKLKETRNVEQFNLIVSVVKDLLPDLTKDNQPEIRSRVVDIKNMLQI